MKKIKEVKRDLYLLDTIVEALEQYHLPPEWVDETIYSYIADLAETNNISYEKARLILAMDIKAGIYDRVLISPTRTAFYYDSDGADVVTDESEQYYSWLHRYTNREKKYNIDIVFFLSGGYVKI